jgi:fibronectin-binding autotransporter adhesin
VEVAGAARVTVVQPRRTKEGTWTATVKADPSQRLLGGGGGGGGNDVGGGGGGGGDADDDGDPADVCIFRVDREFEDTVAALMAAVSVSRSSTTSINNNNNNSGSGGSGGGGGGGCGACVGAEGADGTVSAPAARPLLRLGAWVVGQVKLGRAARWGCTS